MADHGEVEYATARGNDYPEHEATYERFTHLLFIAITHIVNILLVLAIGGVAGHWVTAIAIFFLAIFAAGHGLVTGSKISSVVVLLLALLALVFA